MGLILSRFRKKKTTYEVLEDLDTKIKEIQRYGQTTEQRHKKIVGTLIIYSVVLYIIAAFVFYFYFFPASLRDRFFYITPLLIFPLLIILTKRMVTWYYNRKISRNQDKLSIMQKEKKKILEEVTEVETYKKAKEILMKFAPDQLRMTPLSPQPVFKPAPTESPRRPSTPQAVVAPLPGASELRRRALTVSNASANLQIGRPANSGVAVPVGLAPAFTPQRQTPLATGARLLNAATMGPRSPLPRPILPQQRSYLDRLVEYLVGDGPSNRYALICQQCDSHNGMALKEEFEYFGFRCCYCNFWNPARKQKPSAPRLEHDPLNSPLSSSLQSGKLSELDASSASSSSVQGNSETLSNPSIPCADVPIDAAQVDAKSTFLLPMHVLEVKSMNSKKRRRTIYHLNSHDNRELLQDCMSVISPSTKFDETSRDASETTFSLRDAPIDEPCTVKHEHPNLQCDSDIEVIEKPSQQSENEAEKESNIETAKTEDKSSGDEEKRPTTELTTKPTEDKAPGAQSEEMEVDESPKK